MTPQTSALFVTCEGCGEAAALPTFDGAGLAHCHACAAQSALYDAARVQLEDYAAPVLGAWASVWSAAGLTIEELAEVAADVCLTDVHSVHAGPKRRAHLRRLRMAYPLPSIAAVEVPPLREGVDLDALPYLAAFWPQDPRSGALPSPAFTDRTGQVFRPLPGVDTLTVTLSEGLRAVLYTGHKGHAPHRPSLPTDPVGFRVPADLWPAFGVYMEGRSAWGNLPAQPVKAQEGGTV